MRRAAKAALVMLTTLIFMATVIYPFCLYSQNPFIAQMRDIYIETAMSTLSHQWLATALIPQDIIDEALTARYESQAKQADLKSAWDNMTELSVEQRTDEYNDDEERFFARFNELDRESFLEYAERTPELLEDGYDKVNFDHCGDSKSSIKTTQGDKVLAINAKEGILIAEVTSEIYNGRLAFIKDASRVSVGTCRRLNSHGQFVRDIASRYDAILATNASGFEDPNGVGNGGTPYGFLKSQGTKLRHAEGGDYKIIGFDEDNLLRVGNFKDNSIFRDAVEFQPALIIDGEQLVFGSDGLGVQPRTAIAQKSDKTVMLLVIDGRQPGHSLGCTVGDCAEVFMRYGAQQAALLDGGSSSVMYYNGREITKPTTASKNEEGRYLPDAFIVT